MTTGINPDISPAVRRRAAGLLRVQENADGAAARRSYFSKARESDFLPPRSVQHAFRILDGKRGASELDEAWLLEEERRLRADVEAFAAEFFTLPANQRRERWEALLAACQNASPLTARLQALKAGLEVAVKSLPSDRSYEGRLAGQLLRSFPVAPLARAASRQAFLREIEAPSAAAAQFHVLWEKAARHLRAEWPAVASLDQELVRQVAELRGRLRRRSKMQQRSQRQRQAPVAGGKKGKSWWWLLVILVGAFGRLIGGLGSSNNHSPPVDPSPSYSPQSSPRSFITQLPLVDDLFDPAKFDVEIVDPVKLRILRFTPRPGSKITGPNGPQANNGKPMEYGEAYFRLMGVSEEKLKALFARAAEKHPDGTPKTPPQDVGPKPPQSAQGDKTRP